MILRFENLGPIKKGEFDLTKSFYLFVGYNNSGKTLASQLLWSILNSRTLSNIDDLFEVNDAKEISLTTESLDKILKAFSEHLVNEVIPNDFNIEKDHIITKDLKLSFEYDIESIKKSKVKATAGYNAQDKSIEVFTVSKRKGSLKIKFKEVPNLASILPTDFYDNVPKKRFEEGFAHTKKKLISDVFLSILFGSSRSELMFLPSNRKSYFTFSPYFFRIEKERRENISKDIYNLITKKRDQGIDIDYDFILKNNQSDYTAVMDKLLSNFHRLSEEKPEVNSFNKKYLDQLNEILDGDIVIQYEDNTPSLRFNIKGDREKSLKLHLASSSVNQLTALSIYFKYWAEKEDNFLFIDEPEENLHPFNQIKLIDLLIKFSSENDNRTLITTHSPLITKHINNYIMLGGLKKKGLLKKFLKDNNLKYLEDSVLDKDSIGVYFFDGENVQNYTKDEMDDTGVFFRDFERENMKIDKLNKNLKDSLFRNID